MSFADQRRQLPDQPGVYLFRDERGRVIYVGKAKSVRKRVASHFSKASSPSSPGHEEMVAQARHVECVVVGSETEALLAEQSFIKQYRPRFNVKLRDDKSYPYIAVSLDEDFPRVYFTREKHREGRAYFGPYSNAKRVRGTLDLLGKVFMFRTCDGAVPGRRSGSPCLDYHIKRCEAPCVGYISREQYRKSIDAVVDFLSGRLQAVESDLREKMEAAAAVEDFEQATLERNRLRAVRSLLEHQRVVGAAGTFDVVAVALDGVDANAQVFQVRDGVLSDRQSFFLCNEVERTPGEVIEEFLLQYYAGSAAIPPKIIVQRALLQREQGEQDAIAEVLSARRRAPVQIRAAERGEKRKISELAERNAVLALDAERLRLQRRRQSRIEALEGLRQALGIAALPLRIECFDVSNLGGTHTVASMVVFENGTAKKADYRRFTIRTVEGSDDYASLEEALRRRVAKWQQLASVPPHETACDSSFATLPSLIVIDGGKGQLTAALRALGPLLDRGVAAIALAKRIEEVFLPDRREPLLLDERSAPLQLLQRVRDEAHRFALAHHRVRRDRAMSASLLDGLPGVGPARKRALLFHFGSPEAILEASREELQAVPGVPPKVGRSLHALLHKTG